METIVRLQNVNKVYKGVTKGTKALKDCSLEVKPSSFYFDHWKKRMWQIYTFKCHWWIDRGRFRFNLCKRNGAYNV